MLDRDRCTAERPPYPRLFQPETSRLGRILVRDHDRLRLDLPYDDLSQPLFDGFFRHADLRKPLLQDVRSVWLACSIAERKKLHHETDRALVRRDTPETIAPD